MHFNFFHFLCFLFFLLVHTQRVSALVFEPIIGGFVKGAQVSLGWNLDGSEPASGWELWYVAGGVGIKLENIPPLETATVVPFPGGGNGTFQGLSGTIVLATSDLVTDATIFVTGTTTFSAKVTSGAASSAGSTTSASSTTVRRLPSSAAAESTASSSTITTNALLGIIVGTLAVIAIIVIASVALFIHRRRRVAENRYPFAPSDVESQLAKRITPFNSQPPSSPPLPPLPLPTPPGPRSHSVLSTSDSRRQAYLNAQLQKLEITQVQQRGGDTESVSIVFGPLSSVPSDTTATPTTRPSVSDRKSLPAIPESASRRDAHLAEQDRLAGVNRRLSSVQSASTARPYTPSASSGTTDTARPYAHSISTDASTVGNSPIQFRQEPLSPVTPVTRVAP